MLNKNPDVVPEEAPLIVLDSNSAIRMANIGKCTKHRRLIARRIHFVRIGENYKVQNIDWCGGVQQLEDISTKNIGERDLTALIKYIMVIIDNCNRTFVHEG